MILEADSWLGAAVLDDVKRDLMPCFFGSLDVVGRRSQRILHVRPVCRRNESRDVRIIRKQCGVVRDFVNDGIRHCSNPADQVEERDIWDPNSVEDVGNDVDVDLGVEQREDSVCQAHDEVEHGLGHYLDVDRRPSARIPTEALQIITNAHTQNVCDEVRKLINYRL